MTRTATFTKTELSKAWGAGPGTQAEASEQGNASSRAESSLAGPLGPTVLPACLAPSSHTQPWFLGRQHREHLLTDVYLNTTLTDEEAHNPVVT